jgi:CDP-diacylglycerol--glycerol-3-phosphate 3-phosphatidyltransferase
MSGRGDQAGGGSDALAQMTNLPNLLTLTRIAAVPMIVWLLRDPAPGTAVFTLAIYIVAAVTDFFDGYLARRYGLTTTLGKLLDPLADKLLIVSALIMLAVVERPLTEPSWMLTVLGVDEPTVPGWLLVIIVGRELAVTGLRSIAANEGIVLAAEVSGKIKMILQAVGVGALIGLLLTSTAVGLTSAVQYHIMVFRELSGRSR